MSATQQTVYRPEQEDLYFPAYPTFDSIPAERWHRRQRLAAVCRVFAKFGYEYGFAGHVTVRDPEHPDLYWTNPFAMDFGRVRASDMLLVDHLGTVLEGRWAVNRAGFVLHSAIHEANRDLVASCHAHTTHGMAWAALGRELDPITQTACGFYEDQALITEEAGAVVVENLKGHAVARAFGNAKIAIHQNHGLFSAGRESVEEAAWWFIAAERACEIQLKAEATGKPLKLIGREAALHSKKHLATPFMAWLHFQPIYDAIVRQQPDCLL
ncbi:class II aldolase/adducin family protein [Achromobacter marplatensis]|uniref:Ribulose-5-phosphate 4-epimerase/fuculose-1-phosphate aldolase n=1 Tax=Achromobacter marplatensis TaxID=470868 RepID=A0ABX9FY16_9BURK|nr:class II aldolase/adducin family protein [Achromobacter marplatensis]OWT56347.1 class II aldolase/adducin family protein [Achromobacter marplatensis]RBP12150.1 ribulose-5-phosphate 4-epimerase/fuculose-1-phosphate aldolase [Achromobacter marplatensis]CAB3708419.1 Decarboxylase NovR [Achromobacter marplatensis]